MDEIEEIEKRWKNFKPMNSTEMLDRENVLSLLTRIRELEADLKLNASMPAKQCDLVRQLQTSHDAHMDIASKRINQAESEVKRLEASVRELQDANNNLNEFMLKHCPNLKRT